MVDLDQTEAAAKTALNDCGKECASARSKWMVTREAVLPEAKAVHVKVVDTLARSEADANEKQADFRSLTICLDKVEQEIQLAVVKLNEVQKKK